LRGMKAADLVERIGRRLCEMREKIIGLRMNG
jgi:hypothetical protein